MFKKSDSWHNEIKISFLCMPRGIRKPMVIENPVHRKTDFGCMIFNISTPNYIVIDYLFARRPRVSVNALKEREHTYIYMFSWIAHQRIIHDDFEYNLEISARLRKNRLSAHLPGAWKRACRTEPNILKGISKYTYLYTCMYWNIISYRVSVTENRCC